MNFFGVRKVLYLSPSLSVPQLPLVKGEDGVTSNLGSYLDLKMSMFLLPGEEKGINVY